MKVAFVLSLLASAAAFAPSSHVVVRRAALQAASGLSEEQRRSPRLGEENTEPVAEKSVSWAERMVMKDVMIDPDYTLAASVAALCPLIIYYHPSYYADGSLSAVGVAGGIFHLLFAALLWVQTRRVRCVFKKDSFEFFNIKGYKLDLDKGAKLVQKPDNYVSGTVNRWSYDKIINWGFFPSEDFPVICYFKETETPKEQWNKWFAAFDSYQRGQPHFFPGICNVHQFKEEMIARGVKRKAVPTWNSRFDKK